MKVVLLSHGKMAEGIHQAVEMITGPQKDLLSLGLLESESPKEFMDRVRAILPEESFTVLVDLRGGTPFNVASLLQREKRFPILTGMNLPMVLEAVLGMDENNIDGIPEKTRISIELLKGGE